MKRSILTILAAVAMYCAANAQNIIVTNAGDAIKAYNLEMTDSSVFYQASDADDAPIQKINKSDILIIKMQDGTKLDPNAAPKEEAPARTEGIITLTGDAAARNAAMIADFNKDLTWEPDEKFLKKHQGKTGNGYFGVMWVSDDSQLHNGEITVSYQRGMNVEFSHDKEPKFADYSNNNFIEPYVIVKVKNNTDKVIYLDLSSCFIMSGEESFPFYVPEVKTVTNTNTNASSSEYTRINVDENKVKASDHTYVSGNSSTVTKVKEAQKYVTVAPKSTLSLDPQPVCKTEYGKSDQMYAKYSSLYMSQSLFPFRDTPYGRVLDIAEEDSPYTFGTCISYSFHSDHSDMHSLRTNMYLRYVMCTTSDGLFSYTIESGLYKRYPFWIPFYVVRD